MEESIRAVDEIVGNCLAVRVSLISREITNLYDAALQSHGHRPDQQIVRTPLNQTRW
jgi:hypothetical protein